jgi:hypothetical protein
MTYKGAVKGGMIALAGAARLPEGAAVEVREVEAQPASVADRYRSVVGIER